MTDEQRAKIEKFLLEEFGPECAEKATEEDKQGWFEYFEGMRVYFEGQRLERERKAKLD